MEISSASSSVPLASPSNQSASSQQVQQAEVQRQADTQSSQGQSTSNDPYQRVGTVIDTAV